MTTSRRPPAKPKPIPPGPAGRIPPSRSATEVWVSQILLAALERLDAEAPATARERKFKATASRRNALNVLMAYWAERRAGDFDSHVERYIGWRMSQPKKSLKSATVPMTVVKREVAFLVASTNRFARAHDASPSASMDRVIHAESARAADDPAATSRERAAAARRRAVLANLLDFWAGRTVGEARRNVDDYAAHRLRQPVAAKPAYVTRNTAKADLEILKAEIHRFADEHGLHGCPEMKLEKRQARERTLLTRSDVARLLWATLGWSWDPDLGRCRRVGDIKLFRLLRTHRKALGRMILVSAYTASEPEAIARLHWHRDREPGGEEHSFVEIDGPTLLHRLGPDRAEGRLGGVPVKLNRRITAHLRRWRRLGLQEPGMVIAHPDGSAYDQGSAAGFGELVTDAGLPGKVRKGDIRYSAGVYLAQRADVGSRSAAMVMGVQIGRYLELFGEFDPRFQERVMRAFDERPASIARATPRG